MRVDRISTAIWEKRFQEVQLNVRICCIISLPPIGYGATPIPCDSLGSMSLFRFR